MRVRAVDVYGDPLPGPFTAELVRLAPGSRRRLLARDVPPAGVADFELEVTSSYRLEVKCERYLEVAKTMHGAAAPDELEVLLPISPAAVVGYAWPDPFPLVPGVDFDELLEDPQRVAAALNIWAKLWATPLGLEPAAAFVDEVLEVKVDRLYCRLSPAIEEALDRAEEAGIVRNVSAALHEPPPGFDHDRSVKTRDDHGNLQITTFAGATDDEVRGDIDIDESAGLEHGFDVLGHHATGRKTDQVEVQQILVGLQGLDPGWRPLLA